MFAGQSFWRNFWLSVVTITIITLTLLSVNSLVILNVIGDRSINILKDRIDVSVYFKPEVTEAQAREVRTFLSSLAQVNQLEYISQQDALEQFKQAHINDSDIITSLAELDENPLGATLRVTANELGDYPEILSILDGSQYNEFILEKNFNNHQEFIARINKLSGNIQLLGLVAIILFMFIATLIVFNTIRVAIYTQRDAVRVMRLVGAPNWLIRSPFLIESFLYGLIALGITIAIIYPLLRTIQPHLSTFLLLVDFNIIDHFNSNFLIIFGTQLLGIILLAGFSSSIALRRYLKV